MKVSTLEKKILKIREKSPKTLVIGDVMLDHYIFGDVNRISPEAPVPILNYKTEKKTLGGCGNVVNNLVNLGGQVLVGTILGLDKSGEEIINMFSQIGISFKNSLQFENIETTKKIRYLTSSSQLLRLDYESNKISKEDALLLLQANMKSLEKVDNIIVSDYGKGVCHPKLIGKVIRISDKLDKKVFIDPKGSDWSKYKGAFCITPNIKEAEDLLKIKLRIDTDFENAAKFIKEEFNLNSCLITRGADGMTYFDGNNFFHQKVDAQEVYDVSGAGDTVISCFSSCIDSGLTITDSLKISSYISSLVVSHLGTTPFNIGMIKNRK
jgi:D-beta-D-heptose 7-phosphate kinase / D-beta-D-heptose 1-phosphate adenosyltransferase